MNSPDIYMKPKKFAILQLIGVLLLSSVLGCTDTAESEITQEQDLALKALAMAYGQFTAQNRGRPPKSEEHLRKFLDKNSHILDGYAIESVDDVFISPRDNEPYVVVYGKRAKIVAYEATGLDGKRFVADELGIAREVDEAEFAELVPNAK